MSVDYGRAFPLLREAAGTAWGDYTRHAFVEGLSDGSLPRAAFLHYLRQDYVYLIHYARAWALGVVKAQSLAEMQACTGTVANLVMEEMKLHEGICAEAGISRAALEATEERPENMAYTRFVLEAGYSGDFLDLLAALAPCALGYGEIGARLAAAPHAETYKGWIDTYGGDEFQSACVAVGQLFDGALERRLGPDYTASPRWPHLCKTFASATRLEVGFWQMGLTP